MTFEHDSKVCPDSMSHNVKCLGCHINFNSVRVINLLSNENCENDRESKNISSLMELWLHY